ncbi:MAG: type II toxin-antitoxin system PemK/MazF family toxin [Cyclobacteriaceae bacterium]
MLKPNAQNGLKAESEILVFHIRSISKSRLINRIGNTDSATIGQTIKTLNDILKY